MWDVPVADVVFTKLRLDSERVRAISFFDLGCTSNSDGLHWLFWGFCRAVLVCLWDSTMKELRPMYQGNL